MFAEINFDFALQLIQMQGRKQLTVSANVMAFFASRMLRIKNYLKMRMLS
jgi:hypothetical protein